MTRFRQTIKKRLSFFLAMAMVLSLLPIGAFADSFKIMEQKGTEAIYQYKGTKFEPDSTGLRILSIEKPDAPEEYSKNPVYKYQLVDTTGGKPSTIDAYCSDLKTPCKEDEMYSRVPLEYVVNHPAAAADFFSGTPEERKAKAERLRAILIHSDLWDTSVSDLGAKAGIDGLNQSQVMAATQMAIWTLVNNAKPNLKTGAMANGNVEKYYNYLLKLPGVKAEAMANIQPMGTTKTMDSSSTYKAEVKYAIVGLGTGTSTSAVKATATYTLAGQKPVDIAAEKVKVNAAAKTVTIEGVPAAAKITLNLTTVLDGTWGVYLFVPRSRESSQTLVSVVKMPVDLHTAIDIDAPVGLASVTVFKDWMAGDIVLANSAVEDYTATFQFTHYAPEAGNGSFHGLKAAEDMTVRGNGSGQTGQVFEKDKSYMIEEILVNGEAPAKTLKKYFKVLEGGKIQWINADGTNIVGDDSRFKNPVEVKTGGVEIQKRVNPNPTHEAALKNPAVFTFYVTWGKDKDNQKPYVQETFDIYGRGGITSDREGRGTTTSSGTFTLKDNQSAVFSGIPEGTVLTVWEKTDDGTLTPYYVMDNSKHIVTIEGDKTLTKTFNNQYQVGKLTITKEITSSDNQVNWALLPNQELQFLVKGGDGFETTVILNAANPSKTIDVPYGAYTVKEIGGDVSGYALVTTYVDGKDKGTIDNSNKAVKLTVKNNYTKQQGNLMVTKTVEWKDGITAFEKEFQFEIKGPANWHAGLKTGAEGGAYSLVKDDKDNTKATITLRAKNTATATLTNIPAGIYTVTENKDGADMKEYRFAVSASPSGGADNIAKQTVTHGNTAGVTFTNTYSKQSATLIVEKKPVGIDGDLSIIPNEKFVFEVAGPNGYTNTVKLPTPQRSWSVTLNGLTPGDYTVTETGNRDIDNYTVSNDDTLVVKKTIADNQEEKATITNTYTRNTGTVSFQKVIEGINDEKVSFTVKVMDGTTPVKNTYKYTVNGGAIQNLNTNDSGEATIKDIGHNDKITITGLPIGATVTVKENDSNFYRLTGISDTNGWNRDVAQSSATTIVTADGKTVVFNNARETTNITVAKTIANTPANVDWDSFPSGIKFEVVGPTGWGAYVKNIDAAYDFKKVNDTTWSFVLTKDKPSLALTKIPAGHYNVKEDAGSAGLNGYSLTTGWKITGDGSGSASPSSETGRAAAVKDKSYVVTFTNTYTKNVGTIGVSKVLDAHGDKNHEFTFTIAFFSDAVGGTAKVIDPATVTVSGQVGDVTWNNEKTAMSFVIKGGSKVTIKGIPAKTYYKITEAQHAEYTSTPVYTNCEGQVTKDGNISASIKNIRITDGQLTLSKTVTGGTYTGTFKFTIWVNNSLWTNGKATSNVNNEVTTNAKGEIWLKSGETVTFKNIPRGAKVKVEEGVNDNFTPSYLITVAGVDGARKDDQRIATFAMPAGPDSKAGVAFTNALKKGTLTVTKATAGTAAGDYQDKDFTFTLVSVIGTSETPVEGKAYTLIKVVGADELKSTDSKGNFTLKPGEKAVFADLDYGVSYKVSEAAFSGTADGVTFTKPGDKSGTMSKSKPNLTFAFTNTFNYKTGGLKVTKKVDLTGVQSFETAPATGAYTFTLYDGNGNVVPNAPYKIGSDETTKSTNANGVFTLLADQTAEFGNLKNGNYYVVENEGLATVPTGFTFDKKSGDGKDNAKLVSEGATPEEITVTNSYIRNTGELSVTKTVVDLDADKSYSFTLYYGSAEETNRVENWDAAGSATTDANGVFTLKHDQTAIFKGLPVGTYVVVENVVEAQAPGYSLVVTPSASQNAKTGDALEITNTYTRVQGNLTVSKEAKVTLGDLDLTNWSYDFTISGPSDWTGNYYDANGAEKYLTSAGEGKFKFTLTKDVSSLELKDLPGGDYTVTELTTSGPDSTGYVMTTTANTVEGTNTTVTVGGDQANAKFVNSYRLVGAELTLQKLLSGVAGNAAEAKVFKFTLEKNNNGTWETVKPIILDATGANSKTTLALPVGEYRIWEDESDIALDGHSFAGVSYFLDESETATATEEPDKDGKKWLTFEVEDETTIAIKALNTYEKDGARLRVTKKVDGYAGANDSFTFKLIGGTVTERVEYTLVLADGTSSEKSMDATRLFELKQGETAIFRGLDTGLAYTVEEVKDKIPQYYALTKMEVSSFTFVKSAATTEVPTELTPIENPEKTDYTIKATAGARDGDKFPGLDFVFTNTRATGAMSVTKQLVGSAYDENPFTIYVTFLDNKALVDANLFKSSLKVNDGEATITDKGSVELKLKPGDVATIAGIPAGLTYKLGEDAGDHYYNIDFENDEKVITDEEKPVAAKVINTRKVGSVNLTKKVWSDQAASKGEDFAVEITFKPEGTPWTNEILKDYFDCKAGDGGTATLVGGNVVVTATLKHEQSVDIQKIPAGATYTVEEKLEPEQAKRFAKTLVGADGTVDPYIVGDGKDDPSGDTITLNNFEIPKDTLVVMKDVVANPGSSLQNAQFSFTLSLVQPDGDSYMDSAQIIHESKLEEHIATQKEAITQKDAEIQVLAEAFETVYGEAYAAAVAARDAMLQGDKLQGYELTDEAREELGDALLKDCTACKTDEEGKPTGQVDNYSIPCTEDYCVEGTITPPAEPCTAEGCFEGKIPCTADGCGEACKTCGGNGKVDCLACEAGLVKAATEDCETCVDGKVIDPEEPLKTCDKCEGTGKVEDGDAVKAAIAEAEKTFDENPAVLARASLETAEAELKELQTTLAKMEDILKKLQSGYYVDWDTETFKILEEKEPTGIPLALTEADIVVYDRNSGEKLSTSVVNFKVDEKGVASFQLTKDQVIHINNLPLGSRYVLTEVDIPDSPEAFLGCEVSHGDGTKTPGTTSSGVVTEDGTVGNVVTFKNKFADAFGSLHVKKTWVNSKNDVESVTITLFKDGMSTGQTLTLSATNGWQGSFTNLALGSTYSVVESAVAGYTVSYSHDKITLQYANKDSQMITVTNTGPSPEGNEPPTTPPTNPPKTPETPTPEVPIVDDPVSLNPFPPEEPALPPEEPEVIIPEEDVPLGSFLPQTGDQFNWIVALSAMLASAAGAAAVLVSGRKKRDEEI